MQRFAKGDRVRVDIPDETDPDHEAYHGEHGRIVAELSDDADAVTGDGRDESLYRVVLDSGETTDFRWRDLRPPIDDSSGE
jgi:ribosomal protein L21E